MSTSLFCLYRARSCKDKHPAAASRPSLTVVNDGYAQSSTPKSQQRRWRRSLLASENGCASKNIFEMAFARVNKERNQFCMFVRPQGYAQWDLVRMSTWLMFVYNKLHGLPLKFGAVSSSNTSLSTATSGQKLYCNNQFSFCSYCSQTLFIYRYLVWFGLTF